MDSMEYAQLLGEKITEFLQKEPNLKWSEVVEKASAEIDVEDTPIAPIN